jgi:ATP-dependent Zn protease
MNGKSGRRAVRWTIGSVLVLIVLVALFNLFSSPSVHPGPRRSVALSDFLSDIDQGKVVDVTFLGDNITARYRDGTDRLTYAPGNMGLIRQLIDKGVRVTVAPSDENAPTVLGVVVGWVPFVIMILFWWYAIARPLNLVASRLDGIARALENSLGKQQSDRI